MKTLSGDYHQLFFKGFLNFFTVNVKLISLHHAQSIKLISMSHGMLKEMQWLLIHLVYYGQN